jgi:hypothetical protein
VHDVLFEDIRVEMEERFCKPLIQRSDSEVYVNPDPEYRPPVICVEVRYHHEYSAGGARRGKNHDITFRNVALYGDKKPLLKFAGYSEEFGTDNILVKGLTHNGAPVRSLDACECTMNEFCSNIRVEE